MTERIEQLLQAGNEASARVRNLWITFLLFGTYLAIAIGGTTHRQMLLEAPIVLPILGAELPLVHFYQVAPILFLIFHFYLLVQLYLLAQKLHLLEDAITGPAVPKGARGDLRARTDNFLITQLLVGKTGGVLPRLFIRWAAWLTMIFAPVLLLLAFQVQFLAYHDVFTTWLHRATLIACVLIVWLLWPVITHPGGRLGGVFTALFIERPLMFATAQFGWQKALTARLKARDWRGALALIPQGYREIGRASNRFFYDLLAMVVLVGASLAVIGFSVLVATIPAEEMERWLLDYPLPDEKESATGDPLWWLGPPQFRKLEVAQGEALPPFFSFHTWTSQRPRERPVPVESEPNAVWWPTALLFEGEPDRTSSKATSLFSRNLMLIDDIDLVTLNDDELEKTDRTLVLRGRDLRYARFDRADMRKADMFGANLAGAELAQARLDGVMLQQASMQGAYLGATKMQGADLQEARMQGANLEWAQMQRANLRLANMQGAGFGGARMQGANLSGARMQGADLSQARLQGANLSLARMEGVNLRVAEMQGADLSAVHLHGADLGSVSMQGASLVSAGMQGVSLFAAKMQGADLREARMEGAFLGHAKLQGADLRFARIWMIVTDDADLEWVDTTRASIRDPFPAAGPAERIERAALTIAGYINDIPEGKAREQALKRLDVLRNPSERPSVCQPLQCARNFISPEAWNDETEDGLGVFLGELGCQGGNAPHIARGLLRRMEQERENRGFLSIAAARMSDKANCAGVGSLTEDERTRLQALADGKQ